MSLWDSLKGVLGGGMFSKKFRRGAKDFLLGTPEEMEWISNLDPNQQKLHEQYLQALSGKGAGGAFGDAADYYRSLLDPNSQTAQEMFAPEMRQFKEDIIPGLSEQFAGMGSGGLSSSGFRNAAVSAGTDLQERLGAIRAQLKQQGAAGLAGLAQGGLSPIGQNVIRGGQPGFLGQIAPGLAQAGLAYATGGASLPFQASSMGFGKSSPYGKMGWGPGQ